MTWQSFPIQHGHAPDLPRTDGFLITNAVPLAGGIGSDYAFMSGGVTVNSTPLGMAEFYTTAGVREWYVGTATKLYKWNGLAILSDLSAGVYAASTDYTWSFARFGDNTLAINLGNTLQRSVGGGVFASVLTAPKGHIVVNAGFPSAPQIFIFGYDTRGQDVGGELALDGWFASDISTDTGWSALYANGGASGRLLEPTGPITAAIAFRDGVLAFKKNAMYYGEFDPDGVNVIQWRRISGKIGCIGKNAVCAAEDAVYFASDRGFYVFDGSYPRRLPGFVHDAWSDTMRSLSISDTFSADFVCAAYSDFASVVRWSYPVAPGYGVTGGYCYNIKSGLWTAWDAGAPQGESGSQPMIFASYDYGVNASGVTQKRGTNYLVATVETPCIGAPGAEMTIRGFWPMWKQGKGPADAWGGATFYGAKTPDMSQTSASASATQNMGRADGMASGQWVYADADIYTGGAWEFGAVQMDITRGRQ